MPEAMSHLTASSTNELCGMAMLPTTGNSVRKQQSPPGERAILRSASPWRSAGKLVERMLEWCLWSPGTQFGLVPPQGLLYRESRVISFVSAEARQRGNPRLADWPQTGKHTER